MKHLPLRIKAAILAALAMSIAIPISLRAEPFGDCRANDDIKPEIVIEACSAQIQSRANFVLLESGGFPMLCR
jgi:hypothetical protein